MFAVNVCSYDYGYVYISSNAYKAISILIVVYYSYNSGSSCH